MFLLPSFIILLSPFGQFCHAYQWPQTMEFLRTQDDLKQFTQLLEDSREARGLLNSRELTLLAPTDEAFEVYRGRIDDDLVIYHLLATAINLDQIHSAALDEKPLQPLNEKFPNIWVTRNKQSWMQEGANYIYLNNALLLGNDSDHECKTYTRLQLIHKLNRVLSPMSAMNVPPTAYDLLSQTSSWPLVPYQFERFNKRVITTESMGIYKAPPGTGGGRTYLIPADEFRTPMEDSEISQQVIRASIIPSVVFITSSQEGLTFPTLDQNIEVIIQDNSIQIKDNLRGLSKDIPILIANIPLKNGVAHIVRHMPGLFRPKMAPLFPVRTVWEYINNDYTLQTMTRFMENLTQVDFQNLRNDVPLNFTVFLVEDSKWEQFLIHNGKTQTDLEAHKMLQRFMMRHITEGLYDTHRLVDVSTTSLRGDTLVLGSGDEKILAKFFEDQDAEDHSEVTIVWGTKRLRMTRTNIRCTNGIVHIIDSPFIFDSEVRDEPTTLLSLWKAINRMIH